MEKQSRENRVREKEIKLTVQLDQRHVPESIEWQASDAPDASAQACDAFLLALWDSDEQATLRIDLWTKKMQVVHMNAFFFQTLMTMADTYQRATGNEEAAQEMRELGRRFGQLVPLPPEAS